MASIIYIGIDVHKETYSVAAYDKTTNKIMFETKLGAKQRAEISWRRTG